MSRVGLPLLPKLVVRLHNHSTELVMIVDWDHPTFMHVACFSVFFSIKHHTCIQVWWPVSCLFWKNPYIKCSSYYIVFSKPYHLCPLSLNNNWINSMEETGTPNVRTHILLYPERYFMIKQTLKQQKKPNQFSWITNCVIHSSMKLLTWS